jgi:hypothetical protein
MKFFVLYFGPNKDLVMVFMTDITREEYEKNFHSEVTKIVESYDLTDLDNLDSKPIEKEITELFHSKDRKCGFMDNIEFVEA